MLKLLLVGEDRDGGLVRSLEAGLRSSHQVSVVDPAHAVTHLLDQTSPTARLRRRVRARHTRECFLEAVRQLGPDVTLVVKGRGIDPEAVRQARASTRVAIYYPDNPFWGCADTANAMNRIATADLTVVWSDRLRELLRPICHRVETVAFGYDERWFPLTDPASSRDGVAFVGTWSLRRERYLRALDGLPLTIVGSGWDQASGLSARRPVYGTDAGAVLQQASVGVNIFHPHNSGAHNMRTREIAASGGLQLTDPGTDGTPLRDGDGCRWFRSPAHLRELVEMYLGRAADATAIALRGQQLVASDTYRHRADELTALLRQLT